MVEASSVVNSVSESTKEKVKDVLWLDRLKEEENTLKQKIKERITTEERCMVCTLSYGTCEHTKQWLDTTMSNLEMDSFKSVLEKEIDDVLNVFDDGFQLDTVPVAEDIDITGMQWNRLEQRLSDKIGATDVSLFAPDERGWHSTVKLNDKLVVVFGGFRYKRDAIPQPFKAVPNAGEIEYLNDLRIYDVDNLCWFGVRARGGHIDNEDAVDEPLEPEGRYGHIAAQLTGDRMLLFGGRGGSGRSFNDTWVYHMDSDRWEWVHRNEDIGMPVPSSRYFAAATTLPGTDKVYLFGGTNGLDNCGDLWLFDGSEDVMRWERLIAVGMPPSPRYGHQCVAIDSDQIAILGGCHVSPSGEMVGSTLSATETKALMEMSSSLQKRYKAENAMAARGGLALESNVDYHGQNYDGQGNSGSMHIADIYRQAANLSGSLHLLEQDTRIAELQMMNSYKLSQASTAFNIHSAKHSTNHLDIVFLNTKETMWRAQIYPPIKGKLPVPRIHFGAAVISNYLFVFGGIEPTSKAYKHVDSRHTQVNTLNLTTMRWDSPVPINSADYLIQPLRMAEADVIRAKRRIDEEKFRGLSLGALNGKTVELAEAETVLSVCQWRLAMLRKEEVDCINPPSPRFGCTLTAVNQRLIYTGGWDATRAVAQGEVMVLNLEQEHEKRRRLDDEFRARLERDRIKEEAQANLMNVQSVFELRAILLAEKKNMEREQRDMAKEEFLSSLSPLSRPSPVQLVKANQHTIWIKWDRVTKSSNQKPIDPEKVTYMLYMQSGFENLLVNDRVFATVEDDGKGDGNNSSSGGGDSKARNKKKQRNQLASLFSKSRGLKRDQQFRYFDNTVTRFPGEITKVWGNGTFEVLLDDGHTEKEVARNRIILAPQLPQLTRPGTAESNASASAGTATVRPNTAELVMAPAVKSRIAKKIQAKQKALIQLNIFRTPATQPGRMSVTTGIGSRASDRQSISGRGNSPKKPGSSSPSKASSVLVLQSGITDRDTDHDTFMQEMDSLMFERPPSDYNNQQQQLNIHNKPSSRPSSSRPGTQGTFRGGGRLTRTPTVVVDPRWKLVYMGSDCSYTVTNLVPTEVFDREPDIIVPVAFCLQTQGVDSPDYEHSQLSERVIFLTRKPAVIRSVEEEENDRSVLRFESTRSSPRASTVDGTIGNEDSRVPPPSAVMMAGMSKTRKDIISAVINGQQMVQIERRNNAVFSQGTADHYM